ncbi:MAG: HEAT repeat domain-containing protein [Nitrospira sp.]|nr:HEAT repeat domain-containing protein [Nitrospira sp.]
MSAGVVGGVDPMTELVPRSSLTRFPMKPPPFGRRMYCPQQSVTTQKPMFEESKFRRPTVQPREDRTESADPPLPDAVAHNLTSADPRVRYQALDYWDAKGDPVPLDPVFEAMEDEDPAVRARATAIVEQAWASEEEKEGK